MRSSRWIVLGLLAGGCNYDWDSLRFDPDAASDRPSADVALDREAPDATDVPESRDVADVRDARDEADAASPEDAADVTVAVDVRDGAVDVVRDVMTDAVTDVARDATPDATPDAAPDATPDAAPDATPDATPDAAPDVPACMPAGPSCPCAAGNPGGYCRPGESCSGGRCVMGSLAGSLVITEIMNDPNAVLDDVGEWVEIHNPGATPLDLRGLRLSNGRMQSTTLASPGPVVIAPGAYAVLARNMVTSVTPLWVYGGGLGSNTLTFSNSAMGDSVILDLGTSASEIDRVTYLDAPPMPMPPWPNTTGRAKSLRPGALSATANDLSANWCNAPSQWTGAGDYGSPGAANPACTVVPVP